MVRFDNPTGRDAAGHGCDIFGNHCDHIFRFALDRGDRYGSITRREFNIVNRYDIQYATRCKFIAKLSKQ